MKLAYLYVILMESDFQRNQSLVKIENHKMTLSTTAIALWLPVFHVDILWFYILSLWFELNINFIFSLGLMTSFVHEDALAMLMNFFHSAGYYSCNIIMQPETL